VDVKFTLNQSDLNKINHLLEIKDINISIAEMLQYFFKISENNEKANSEEDYLIKMLAKCDVVLSNEEDNDIVQKQIKPDLKCMDEKIILNDQYVQSLKIPETTFGNYTFKKETYKPYQAFSYDEISVIEEDYREVQKVGYFASSVEYLALAQNDEVWMSIIPNEINTHIGPISHAYGDVVTFGLGIGYFVYHVIQKDNVKSLTIIEKDKIIINFFNQYILPQLAQKEKIIIIHADAYSYIKETHHFDCAYVDLWHNPNDGLPFYIAFKNAERNFPNCQFDYWLETSILSLYRRCLLTVIEEQLNNTPETAYLKSKTSEDKIINDLYFKTKDMVISRYQQVHDLLNEKSLKELICK